MQVAGHCYSITEKLSRETRQHLQVRTVSVYLYVSSAASNLSTKFVRHNIMADVSIDGSTEYLMSCTLSNVGSKLLQVVQCNNLRSWYNMVQNLVVGFIRVKNKKISFGQVVIWIFLST